MFLFLLLQCWSMLVGWWSPSLFVYIHLPPIRDVNDIIYDSSPIQSELHRSQRHQNKNTNQLCFNSTEFTACAVMEATTGPSFQPQVGADTTNGAHVHTYIPRADGSILIGGVAYFPQSNGTAAAVPVVTSAPVVVQPAVASVPIVQPPYYPHFPYPLYASVYPTVASLSIQTNSSYPKPPALTDKHVI